MKEDEKIRTLIFTDEFKSYYDSLSYQVKDKFDYVMYVIRTQYVVSEKFVKKLQNTDFYEMRVSLGFNEYRTVIFAVDTLNFMEAKQVILLNSFLKKDEKMYKKEIAKAINLLNKMEDGNNA